MDMDMRTFLLLAYKLLQLHVICLFSVMRQNLSSCAEVNEHTVLDEGWQTALEMVN